MGWLSRLLNQLSCESGAEGGQGRVEGLLACFLVRRVHFWLWFNRTLLRGAVPWRGIAAAVQTCTSLGAHGERKVHVELSDARSCCPRSCWWGDTYCPPAAPCPLLGDVGLCWSGPVMFSTGIAWGRAAWMALCAWECCWWHRGTAAPSVLLAPKWGGCHALKPSVPLTLSTSSQGPSAPGCGVLGLCPVAALHLGGGGQQGTLQCPTVGLSSGVQPAGTLQALCGGPPEAAASSDGDPYGSRGSVTPPHANTQLAFM